MSKFEKIVIPFIVNTINPVDLTKATGFIGAYTYDPDRPSGDNEFYLVYDDRVRNEFVEQRALRLESCKNLKKMYVKMVNNIPYFVYSFWVPPKCKAFYSGDVKFNIDDKLLLLKFWGPYDDVVENMLNSSYLHVDVKHDMPLETYPEDIDGITIKKEVVSDEAISFFVFNIK